MHNVVFDISVLVSALITRGKSKEIWLKAVTKEFNLIVSSMHMLFLGLPLIPSSEPGMSRLRNEAASRLLVFPKAILIFYR